MTVIHRRLAPILMVLLLVHVMWDTPVTAYRVAVSRALTDQAEKKNIAM